MNSKARTIIIVMLLATPLLAPAQPTEGYGVGVRIFSRVLFFPDSCELVTTHVFEDDAIRYACSVWDETGNSIEEVKFDFSITKNMPDGKEELENFRNEIEGDPDFELEDYGQAEIGDLIHNHFRAVSHSARNLANPDVYFYEVCDVDLCLGFSGLEARIKENVQRLFPENLYND